MLDVLGLVEHVLGEDALVEPGGGDRADHVEVPGVDGPSQAQGVPRALDVGRVLAVGVGGQVVDRGQVEEVLDGAVEALDLVARDSEALARQIAHDGHDAVVVNAEAGLELIELVERAGPAQGVDRPLALEQFGEQEAPHETGRARDEIHAYPRWWVDPSGRTARLLPASLVHLSQIFQPGSYDPMRTDGKMAPSTSPAMNSQPKARLWTRQTRWYQSGHPT